MELLEYQAKKLFKMVGIPVLPSQTIRDPRKIKQLQIAYPIVLKSQVSSGGRGKAGGVRFVSNTIDAIAAARTIFNLSILGEYPEVILAEAHYNAVNELFLAIVLDYDLSRPVLLGSAFGGMNVDSLLANLQQVVVETEFSLFYARRLAASMGLSGKLICSVAEIIAKMYRLFLETDLDLIEINPLAINERGELMALDGKITIDDNALERQPILNSLSFSQQQQRRNYHNLLRTNKDFSQISWRWLNWHDRAGEVAMICNSFDSALLTWDLLKQGGATPACALLIDNSLSLAADDLPLYSQKLLEALMEIENVAGIKAIFINIWESDAVNRQILRTLNDYCANRTVSHHEQTLDSPASSNSIPTTEPPLVLRLLNEDNLNDLKMSQTSYLFSNLEIAIKKAIAIAKSKSQKKI